MVYTLELSLEQLEELGSMLRRELRESKGELRHTWDADYKQRVRRHIELVEGMVQDIEGRMQSGAHDTMAR